uniref:Sphingolipid delta4-desaturase N-terminal domain-containing protein n=1 Tax=Chromera velia CCMP2878 TaxID=1169474 RepID=A0A0G4GEU4_9ALVE|eukprot:Cvel_21545.t1-p1 / transcript=Cvel_21545.t1 / gene=Cvel_21545 / organism=Chromera_velia_CCMP2878 / gene_product=Sphingolipid delta(4)-desaturase/C4-hydroxylase, putative / transcript_product=Sphingolipid delta(4)-desaturase/C4-hydroxylase, putative / location=Cvel_scaffold2031:13642-15504(-) / protein_length=370 / sequence_SO=supercontig / SO=protein_coding / is_pseudo=false
MSVLRIPKEVTAVVQSADSEPSDEMCKPFLSDSQSTTDNSEPSSCSEDVPSGEATSRSEGFAWTTERQFHDFRRRKILEKYPQIKSLMRPDAGFFPFCALSMCTIWATMVVISVLDLSWTTTVVLAYTVSGTLNHSLQLAVHELSHYLWFPSKLANDALAVATNLCSGWPAALPFKRYHRDHHVFLGVDGMDPDLPTDWEAKFFSSAPLKLLFLILYPLFYSLRPLIFQPKMLDLPEAINLSVVIMWDAMILRVFGSKALFFLVGGTFIGLGLHPLSGHFLAEHYSLFGEESPETASYYGWINKIMYNAGYHVEHHDFPRIPGCKLPEVRRIAAEFYDDLPCHESWPGVLWKFVFDPCLTPFSRLKRKQR